MSTPRLPYRGGGREWDPGRYARITSAHCPSTQHRGPCCRNPSMRPPWAGSIKPRWEPAPRWTQGPRQTDPPTARISDSRWAGSGSVGEALWPGNQRTQSTCGVRERGAARPAPTRPHTFKPKAPSTHKRWQWDKDTGGAGTGCQTIHTRCPWPGMHGGKGGRDGGRRETMVPRGETTSALARVRVTRLTAARPHTDRDAMTQRDAERTERGMHRAIYLPRLVRRKL